MCLYFCECSVVPDSLRPRGLQPRQAPLPMDEGQPETRLCTGMRPRAWACSRSPLWGERPRLTRTGEGALTVTWAGWAKDEAAGSAPLAPGGPRMRGLEPALPSHPRDCLRAGEDSGARESGTREFKAFPQTVKGRQQRPATAGGTWRERAGVGGTTATRYPGKAGQVSRVW